MTETEFKVLLKAEVKGLSNYLQWTEDYDHACDDAARETGWTFPITTDFKILWMKQRAKRHLFFYLYTESAHKFKIKTLNLDQRFAHYRSLIRDMDREYRGIQAAYPYEFEGGSVWEMFPNKIDSGFQYDDLGRDTTYDSDNVVINDPNEAS